MGSSDPEARRIENRLPSRLKLLNPLEVAVLLEFHGPVRPDLSLRAS
jgi:hypothetical protein